MHIQAIIKSEGSTYNVRLIDEHGIELPMFVYEARYDDELRSAGLAKAEAKAVCEFINTLCPSARLAMYNAQR